MKSQKVLIVGCGDIGCELANKLMTDDFKVYGVRRNIAALPEHIIPVKADIADLETLSSLPAKVDFVIYSLTPSHFSDEAYKQVYIDGINNLLQQFKINNTKPKKIFFISSTSVYGQADGENIDETSETKPKGFAGKRLLEAENIIKNSGYKNCIIRFSGIYGADRCHLIKQVLAGTGCAQTPPLMTNRIHRDDCVGIIHHLIELCLANKTVKDCYLGVDNEPVPLRDVLNWLAEELKVDELSDEEIKSRRGNKVCSNKRITKAGYAFKYPTYREGYEAVLADLDSKEQDNKEHRE